MSAIVTTPGENLIRSTGTVSDASDYTVAFWWKATAPHTDAVIYYFGNDPIALYTSYVLIYVVNSGGAKIKFSVGLNGATQDLATLSSYNVDQWYRIAYVRSGTAQRFYFDGALIGTVTSDLSTTTDPFDTIILFDDGYGAASADQEIAYAREWDNDLAINPLLNNWASRIPVTTANLWSDATLAVNGDDDSGNNRDWTITGSVAFIAPPSNSSSATAIDISSLPYSNTQTVSIGGPALEVWYKYTSPTTKVIGIWGFGDLTIYTPTLDAYGPNSSSIQTDVATVENIPIQLVVAAGSEYFFKFTSSSGSSSASLAVSILDAPDGSVPVGSLFINDDTPNFPAAIISAVDGEMLKFIIPFPAGEAGDSVLGPIAFYAVEDIADSDIKVYDVGFNQIAAINPIGNSSDPLIRANQTLDLIYFIGKGTSPTNSWFLQSIDSTGIASAQLAEITINKTEAQVRSFAVSNDGNLVYIAGNSSYGIQVWNISGAAFDADLAAGIVPFTVIDILVLKDDTIVALYINSGAGAIQVIHYDPSGTVLNTFDYGTDNEDTTFQHIAYALDDPNSFWLWTHPLGTGTSRFRNVRLSDGSNLVDFERVEYEVGVYNAEPTETPLDRFGISLSCPFFLIGGSGLIVTKIVIGTDTEFDFTTTGGLTPDTFSLSNGESQEFNDLAVGTYGVTETEIEGYTTTYEVSNGDPHDAIEIDGTEVVIVTVTNTESFQAIGGIYKVVPWSRKPEDTLYTDVSAEETFDVKIPDPTFRLPLLGD